MGRSAEQLNFKIITTGKDEVDSRKPCNLRPLNLEKLIKWINKQQVTVEIKEELIKSASTYPHQALSNWQKNYTKHVSVAQAKLRKNPKPKSLIELGDEPESMQDEKRKKTNGSSKPDGWDEFENPGGDQG